VRRQRPPRLRYGTCSSLQKVVGKPPPDASPSGLVLDH
jgi:hypothetical protein